MMKILKVYEEASGQVINVDKSIVFFSKNTEKERKGGILNILRGMKAVSQSKYLGRPKNKCSIISGRESSTE